MASLRRRASRRCGPCRPLPSTACWPGEWLRSRSASRSIGERRQAAS